MKLARYFIKHGENVKCTLCPKKCVIKQNCVGSCKVRKNIDGKLYSLVYGQPIAIAVDPVEKKPLYHFNPNTDTYSIGTSGCNAKCTHCQNYEISQELKLSKKEILPEEIIERALKNKSLSISYTYNEPTVFFEYLIDIAKIAKERGIRNIMISNGFINKNPLKELLSYVDAFNIDLKSFNAQKLIEKTGIFLPTVLENIKLIYDSGKHLEITHLVVPGLSEDEEEFEEMCIWINKFLSRQIPLHISRFHPDYKMTDVNPTDENRMMDFYKIAKKYLDFVYLGNIHIPKTQNTYCPSCNKMLIGRTGFGIIKNKINKGKCECNQNIYGKFEIQLED